MTGRPSRPAPDTERRRLIGLVAGLAGVGGLSGVAMLLGRRRADDPGQASEPAAATAPNTETTAQTTPPTTATTSTTAPTRTTTVIETTTTTTAPIEVLVVSKLGWQAAPTGELTVHDPVRLTYHHTAAEGADVATAPPRIRGYQRYHLDQGWPDVAYHFLIDQAGTIYEGRPPTSPGDTFTEYDPAGHFLVCLDGNFDTEPLPDAAIESLVVMLGWGCQEFGIDPASLGGHRDYAGTSCPGENAYVQKDAIGEQLMALLAQGRRVELTYNDETA